MINYVEKNMKKYMCVYTESLYYIAEINPKLEINHISIIFLKI